MTSIKATFPCRH